jgi:hypothetical protein
VKKEFFSHPDKPEIRKVKINHVASNFSGTGAML